MIKKENENQSSEYRQDEVEITIKDLTYKIHRGRQSVASIKEIGGVNPNWELSQIINGELEDLNNDGFVVIKGGEVFKAIPPAGNNS